MKLVPAVPRATGAGRADQERRNAQLRERFLSELHLLDAAEVADMSGSRSANRRAVASRWAGARRIFGMRLNGQVLYPAFQFDEAGQPRPAVGEVLEVLAPLNLSEWAEALWWGTASDALGWRTPANVVAEDPMAVVKVALLDVSTLGG